MATTGRSLYRSHELAIRSLYAAVKERAHAAGELLQGTPGTLVKRTGTGHEYWYRSYYPRPKKRSEEYVGPAGNPAAHEAMQTRIANAEGTAKQVSALAKLGYHVADKRVAGVLVELHNQKILGSGLIVVGTLATLSWLNEYGARASAARAQDLGPARGQSLKLAATGRFLTSAQAADFPLAKIRAAGLRLDMLAPGLALGEAVAGPGLPWQARGIPFYDYLLEGSREAVMLAGGHCIPLLLPDAAHMIWHHLYASTRRAPEPAKADKDLLQAAMLAAVLTERDGMSLRESFRDAPRHLRAAAFARLRRMDALLAAHPRALEEFRGLA